MGLPRAQRAAEVLRSIDSSADLGVLLSAISCRGRHRRRWSRVPALTRIVHRCNCARLSPLRDECMTLRILTVLAGASVGGAETFFVSLTMRAGTSRTRCALGAQTERDREAALAGQGILFDLAPFGSLLDFSTGAVLRRMADEFQPDVVLAFAGRAASFLPRGGPVRIGRLGGYYNLKNFRHCDHLVCNAPDLVRYVTDGGWSEERVSLIPNFPSIPDGPKLDRGAFDTPEDAPLALALGRLHPAKGLDILIRAAASIPGLFVWIAGEGPERENSAASRRGSLASAAA